MASLQNSDQVTITSQDGTSYKMAFSDFRNSLDTYYSNIANNNTFTGGQTFNGTVTYGASSGQVLTATTTLTATEIVGTTAGDLGHANGATLIADPASSLTIQFIGAILVYDFATAAYTGGGNDLVICYGSGGTTLSGATTSANLLGAAGDKIVSVYPLTTAGVPMVVGTGISIKSTAWTQPGTAAGVLRCTVYYRLLTTGL